MKNILITLVLLLSSLATHAQVLNDQINVIYSIRETYSSAANEEGPDEWTMRFRAFLNGEAEDFLFSTFEGTSFGTSTDLALINNGVTNLPYNTTLNMELFAWEDDEGSRLEYDDGDDELYFSIFAMSECLTCAGPAAVWNTDLANNGSDGWITDAMMPNTDFWDYRLYALWRYSGGDSFDEPLIFGDLVAAGERFNVNSTAQQEGASGTLSTYNNDFVGWSSEDVYYIFSLSDNRGVTISTDHPETDFDTFIYLLDSDGNIIDENDDVDDDNRSSRLERELCAGTYYIVVEGYENENGNFRLTAEADGFIAPFENLLVETISANCDDSADGFAMAQPDGGIGPYEYEWENITTGETYANGENLPAGNYEVQAIDVCGVMVSEVFTINVEDTIPPTAVCDDIVVEVIDDPTLIIDMNPEFNAVLSFDNCGTLVNLMVSPATYTSADGPELPYTLTISDPTGNTSSCSANLLISVVTSVTQDQELARAIDIFPNPTSSTFQLSAQELDLQAGHVYLRDLQGQLVYQQACPDAHSWSQVFNIDHLPAGIYTLQVRANEKQYTHRLVKN